MPPQTLTTTTHPNPQPDIWKQMSYPTPRGSCAHKPNLLTPGCACLRFMIHPLKARSTFDCDGCGHHASFHRMENRADEEVVARWGERERNNEEGGGDGVGEGGRARKVRRVGGGVGVGVGGKRKLLAVGGKGAETETGTETVGEGEGGDDGVQVVGVGVVARSRVGRWG